MNEKNMCSYTDRKSEFNSFANDLYSPKKDLFTNLCETTNDPEIKNICNNNILTTYNDYAECPNKGFFVTKPDDNENIYVLDSCLNEIDNINLNVPNKNYIKEIQGIAYDPDLAKIYIAHQNKVFSVNNQGDFIKDELNKPTLNEISSNKTITIASCNPCIPQTTTTTISPNIQAIGRADNNILVAYQKNGSNFLAKLTANGNLVNKKYIDDNVEPTNILETSCGIHVLAKKDNKYIYFYTYDKNSSCCRKKKNYCEIILDGECRMDIECDFPWPCSLDTSICEVVKSVALIENALATLINCESEKIKDAINKSKCTKELVDINNSVSKTITNISMLEQNLKEKLDTALEIYKETNHHPPHHINRPCN